MSYPLRDAGNCHNDGTPFVDMGDVLHETTEEAVARGVVLTNPDDVADVVDGKPVFNPKPELSTPPSLKVCPDCGGKV